MIFNYFKRLKDKIEEYRHIITGKTTSEKNYSDKRGFIEGKVNFIDKSCLDFTEVKDIEENNKLKYSYHYMDEEHKMVFRYDNAKHYPDLDTFPHHKHTAEIITSADEPEIEDILSEIEKIVIKNK